MATGKSIFGKAIGFAASLVGAGSGHAAAAQTADVEAQKVAAAAAVEAEMRSLRLVVRDAGYAAHRNRFLTEKGNPSDQTIFFKPYAKGLELVVVADSALSARPLMHSDLARLKVTQDDIMALARRQLLATLPPVPLAEEVAGGVVALPKADYLASLMLADGWDDLDAALDGHMQVVVPSDDYLMVIDAREADLRDGLPAFVKAKFDDASRSVSSLIYRRQGGAWVAVE